MKRHQFDPFSLIFGMCSVAAGMVFLLGPSDGSLSLEWILPAGLLVTGICLMTAAAQRAWQRDSQRQEG